MSVSAAIRRMLEAGLSIEQALIAADAFEAEMKPLEPVLTKRQARNKRYYDKKKASDSRLNSDDQDVSDDQDAGDDLSSPEGSSPAPPSPNPLQSIPPSPPKGGSSPADEAISAYTAMASGAGLAAVRSVSGARRRNLEARIREHGLPVVLEAIGKIGRSAFCRGENDRGWRADFDFLCQPKSFVALLEGKYDDRPKQQAPPPMTHHQRHQQAAIAELDKRLGIKRNDQQPTSALDLDPADWRAHRTASAGH